MKRWFSQSGCDLRCEWGQHGIDHLRDDSDVMIIVDVMSFSTSVDIAVSNGAVVYPYRWRDETALTYAQSVGAIAAGVSSETSYTLSPSSLVRIPSGTRLVLPSPNGSTLSMATQDVPTFTACLRNAEAVAYAARTIGHRISIIPAGERWPDGSLRPAIEDWIGVGALIHFLNGMRSPEADIALAAFERFRANPSTLLRQASSGRELIDKGLSDDVELALAFNQSASAPYLLDGCYTAYATAP